GNQEFVSQRVEQHAHGRNLPALACQIAVDTIRDGSRNKQCRSQKLLPAVEIIKAIGGKDPDQQWNAEDPGQRDGVGQVHNGCNDRSTSAAKLSSTTQA